MRSDIKEICSIYNNIVQTALSLSQPSEALDKRWNLKWQKFLNNLQELENHFR